MNLSDNDRAVLEALAYRGPDRFSNFTTIASDSEVDRKAIRRIVRRLARGGLTQYARGLTNEDGEMAGAGYAITRAGYAALGPSDAPSTTEADR